MGLTLFGLYVLFKVVFRKFHTQCVGLDIHRPRNWVCDDCRATKWKLDRFGLSRVVISSFLIVPLYFFAATVLTSGMRYWLVGSY